MNTIKLLIIAPSFYPVHGGAGLRFLRYLPYFHEGGIQTTVICGTPKEKKYSEQDRNANWHNVEDGTLVEEVSLKFAKVLKFKIPASGAKYRSRVLLNKAIQICENETSRPDIVHIIAPMPFNVLDQLKKIKAMRLNLLYSHTIAKEFSKNIIVKYLQAWKIKQVLKHYDRVLVQSTIFRDVIKVSNCDADIKVIPNGVDTDFFSPVKDLQEKNHLRSCLGLPQDACIIILVGAVHPRKGTDLLVDAWARLVKNNPNLHLILVGPRYDLIRDELSWFKERIQSSINQSLHCENIHFVGQSEKVNHYLKVSDMFVFTSEREGMPNAMLEAMATALPVITTPFIGLSVELGKSGIHYLLSERSSQSLSENIMKILVNQKLRQQLSQRARKWIIDNMHISTSAQQHIDVYRCCMNSKV